MERVNVYMGATNGEYLDALKNTSQALARISELDEVVTSEGELAVSYQKNVWLPRIKKMFMGMHLTGPTNKT